MKDRTGAGARFAVREFWVDSGLNCLFHNLLAMAYTYFLQQSFGKDITTDANAY